jgi:hypothetical protein
LSFIALFAAVGLAGPGCESSSPTEPTPACSYTLSPSSLSFGATGGAASVSVATTSQCTWSAASDRAWMSVTSGASGTGPGTVNVTVSAATSSGERTGTLTVAGQTVGVRQDGVPPVTCTIQISPDSASFGKDAATGTFSVSAPEQCQWSAASSAGWLTVTSGSPGTGNGVVGYALERNRDVNERAATIAVGERTFTVRQAGDPPGELCEYSVSPVEFTPCMSVGYELTATVTARVGCTWTAEPDASWITMTGPRSGNGSGVVRFRVSDNWDLPRQSVVKVRWPTVTAGQNLQVRQAGCRYAVSTTAISVAAAGGTGRFDVIQQSEPLTCGGPLQDACLWTAVAGVPWITITTSMPQVGDDPVSFTVAPNTGAARSGTITVRGLVVRITQAGI